MMVFIRLLKGFVMELDEVLIVCGGIRLCFCVLLGFILFSIVFIIWWLVSCNLKVFVGCWFVVGILFICVWFLKVVCLWIIKFFVIFVKYLLKIFVIWCCFLMIFFFLLRIIKLFGICFLVCINGCKDF